MTLVPSAIANLTPTTVDGRAGSAALDRADSKTDPATSTAARLRFAVTRLHRLLRQHSSGDLTLTQGSALATVAKRGPMTLGELAAAEQVSPPTITSVIGKLEQQGFVERAIDDADRRVCRVTATAAGARRLEEIRVRRTAWLSTRLAELPPDDLERLTGVLDLLEGLGADPVLQEGT